MATILLVEDNAEMQRVLCELLELAGHRVVVGRDAHAGLRLLVDGEPCPDVILSDLIMPQMDGLSFLHQVRQNPEWSQVRFIIMTGNARDERVQQALSSHLIDGILPKPFMLEDLDRVLRG